MARTPATAISVSVAAAAELRRLAFTLSAATGERVTMSAALSAAVRVAAADLAAATAALTGEDTAR